MRAISTPTTYGWDLVIATRASVVNLGLADTDDEAFDESVTHGAGPVRVQGTVRGWQITPGGSGSLVNFALACSTLTLSNQQKSYNFSEGQFMVQATLELQVASTSVEVGHHDLVVTSGREAVSVLGATFPQANFAEFEVYAKAALQAWLDSRSSFPYVLASVILGGQKAGGASSVLAPTTATYAYADDSRNDGVLGLLCTVDDGAAPGQLLQEVSPDAVADTDSAVIVSEVIARRLLDGAGAAVTWPGSRGSAVQVGSALAFPMLVERVS